MPIAKINTALVVMIIVINGYVIAAPFVPALLFSWQSHAGKKQQLTRQVEQAAKQPTSSTAPVATSQPNHVIIPSMLLDQPILDGPESQQYKILDKGIWRFSYGSTPDKGGNTVLIGHRFTYTIPKGVFYYLNKVQLGDQIGLWWNNKQYTYKVTSITEVPPTDTAIEKNTTSPELTIFTCTPLWLPKDRLVVVADLEARA